MRFRESRPYLPTSLGGSFTVPGEELDKFISVHAELVRTGKIVPYYTVGEDLGFDELKSADPGGDVDPLWIEPTVKKIPPPPRPPPPPPPPPPKFEGIILTWVRPDHICIPGKPPQPRRSMTLAGPLMDKRSYIAFGGLGLTGSPNGGDIDAPDDNRTEYSMRSIAGNLKREEKAFSDTFLIHDLSKATLDIQKGFAIGETQCQDKTLEYTPPRAPDVAPNDHLNP